MKLISTLLILLSLQSAYAKTWVVSNVEGFPADFPTLQGAILDTRVVNGDILLVQGSGTDYGTIELTKRLTIMGPGYFLNQNPETQAVLSTAKITSLDCKAGSNGSIIQGLEVTGRISLGSDAFPVSWGAGYAALGDCGINIDGVSVMLISINMAAGGGWIHVKNSNGTIVQRCYGGGVFCSNGVSDLRIDNCIFEYGSYLTNAVVRHTIFDLQFTNAGHAFTNCDIRNSMLFPCTNNTFKNSSFSYNIIFGCDPGLGGTNIPNVDGNSVFLGYPNAAGYSNDGRYMLRQGSIARQAGENGVDIGPFGGSNPYKLSGISFHPNIWSVTMPTTGTSEGGLQVQIKANANN